MAAFALTRCPLPLQRRRVAVHHVADLTPSYRRIRFAGEELAGFRTPGADDHIRIFFPPKGEPLPPAEGEGMPAGLASREFTPAVWDAENGILSIDFALHADGVASGWASSARVGDEVFVGGPRGSLLVEGAPDWWLLAGDLTSLPAIRRHLAAVASGTPVDAIVWSDDAADEQELSSPGDLTVRWVHPEPGWPTGDVTALVAALAEVPRRDGEGFAFVAAEQAIVSPARQLLAERGVDLDRAVVKGYWKRGVAEYHAPHGPAGRPGA
ncbi:siderophore-interacting protein [Brooklawnia cerclae]|uniref:NADPH-dependent ferric siderophore reductase n=1 Tax=Brooklawnia cerclae TaxID=349934 RepID=A0ABX0SDC9_9ACTN|nr:siderophore-interacting protein [Brooklawnia cerclae]NIH56387.1 NADPH-dependent ferric siderophore reductase [Brooklawnia cerclae]